MELTKTSQAQRILRLLKTHRSVTNIELNKICYRYSARIHELRNDGYDIEMKPLRRGVFTYSLAEDSYVDETA